MRRNLRRATDGALDGFALERAVSDTFASYGRYWLELFRLPSDARGSVEDRVTSVGFEHITDGLEAGKGVILALPHVGGFDFAAAWLAGRGLPPGGGGRGGRAARSCSSGSPTSGGRSAWR